MNKRVDRSIRFSGAARLAGSLTILALAAGVSVPASAEYRCNSPRTWDRADRQACELAKRGSANELRLFIQRTAPIYGLYFYDYVTPADFERWSSSRQEARPLRMAAQKTQVRIAAEKTR
jgi:hypothetical protein